MLQLQRYDNLPLSFESNNGQFNPEVAFSTRSFGYNIFFDHEEIVLVVKGLTNKTKFMDNEAGVQDAEAELLTKEEEKSSIIRIKFIGTDTIPKIQGMEELPGKVNYFKVSDPSKWYNDIPTFKKVAYREVYPGIDIVYYGNQKKLEHDYIISKGADPGVIALDIQGIDKMKITENGDLIMNTAEGELYFKKPYIYQEVNGTKKEISGGYLLKNSCQVCFQIGDYDANLPLIIDPVLEYSTYLGGSNTDRAYGIAVDTSGNAYVTGYTNSSDFPKKDYIYDYANHYDVFITKINSKGTGLVYSTYLGGGDDDFGYGIAVDASGNAYVTGQTNSSDFPTQGSIQNYKGNGDVFVSKINSAGNVLIYSTYLGGGASDCGNAIAVDTSGNVYVTGYTNSDNFPTKNLIQTYAGNGDGFVTKINSTGTQLVYSTYLGGSDDDKGNAIAVDVSGSVYVTGGTISDDFPVKNAIQVYAGNGDGFVTKINSAGDALVYSTFLGGEGYDKCSGIAVDTSGNAYVTGYTDSIDFPIKNAIQTSYAGTDDAFVTKINSEGTALVYSTYFGGSNSDYGYGIALDLLGNVYISGFTWSSDFPVLNPIQAYKAGQCDVFVAKINFTGTSLIYSTYFGGTGADYAYGNIIAVDISRNAYVVGYTDSNDFHTLNPIQASYAGNTDVFVIKLNSTQFDDVEIQLNSIGAKVGNVDSELKSIEDRIINRSSSDVINNSNLVNTINTQFNTVKNKFGYYDFMLEDIKNGILNIYIDAYENIEDNRGLTTGVVIADEHANSLVVGVLNNTSTYNTVTVYVYDVTVSPKKVVFEESMYIKPDCQRTVICQCPPLVYEVSFWGIVSGIYAWTAARKEGISAPLTRSSFISSNTFNYNQLYKKL